MYVQHSVKVRSYETHIFCSVLSFLLASGAADQAAAWAALSDDKKAAIKSEYNAAGISFIVSAFGATDSPTSNGADPVATANAMAHFVLDNQLDGIDVDYEVWGARSQSSFALLRAMLMGTVGLERNERTRRRRGGMAGVLHSDSSPEAPERALSAHSCS